MLKCGCQQLQLQNKAKQDAYVNTRRFAAHEAGQKLSCQCCRHGAYPMLSPPEDKGFWSRLLVWLRSRLLCALLDLQATVQGSASSRQALALHGMSAA